MDQARDSDHGYDTLQFFPPPNNPMGGHYHTLELQTKYVQQKRPARPRSFISMTSSRIERARRASANSENPESLTCSTKGSSSSISETSSRIKRHSECSISSGNELQNSKSPKISPDQGYMPLEQVFQSQEGYISKSQIV